MSELKERTKYWLYYLPFIILLYTTAFCGAIYHSTWGAALLGLSIGLMFTLGSMYGEGVQNWLLRPKKDSNETQHIDQ